jgi:hypothetical protein
MEPAEKLFLKKYALHFLRTMLLLGLVFVLALVLEPDTKTPLWKGGVLAVLAGISVYFLWGIWSLAKKTGIKADEMGETIWMRGIAYAHSASILLASVYGLLESVAGLPRVSMTTVSVLMIVIGFVSVALVQRRYA